MKTGTREYTKQKFGYHKTKEVFTSDDGLVEKKAPFLAFVRPVTAALDLLEELPNPDESDEGNGPDPDEIKAYLEDALGLLVMPIGNANFQLNAWRQERFGEFLTDVGKRILKQISQQIKISFLTSFTKRSKVNMITRRQIPQLLPSHNFLKRPKGSPFVPSPGLVLVARVPGENIERAYNFHGNQKAVSSRFLSTKIPLPKRQRVSKEPASLTTADYMIPRLNKVTLPEQQTAGRLRHYMSNWKIIASDESVLETVKSISNPSDFKTSSVAQEKCC